MKRLLICAVIFLPLFGYIFFPTVPVIKKEELRISSVKQGELKIEVSGYGKLRSRDQRVISSDDKAIVEKVYFYPGDRVEADTVIVAMSNPELVRKVDQASFELAKHKASMEEKKLQDQYTLLEQEQTIHNLRNQIQLEKLNHAAQLELHKKNIVSDIDFERTTLKLSDLEKQLETSIGRLAFLKNLHAKQIELQQKIEDQLQLNYDTAKQMLDKMQVTAGIAGILQELTVDIGSSVSAGEKIALVGSDSDLVVRLKVPQFNADKIKLGMPGRIQTLAGKVDTVVKRIDPTVVDGKVNIEMALVGQHVPGLRPELTVDGSIEIDTIKNALYIELPESVRANSEQSLLKVLNDTGQWQKLRFGMQSDSLIEIKGGAAVGDRFVLSSLANYSDSGSLKLE
ncbi:hypothetical protein N476_24630 [Pseudoalteromonas luteoviolacea H33]|uniref:Uncharacterized protein n=2 Tax=Pseudoalteromonas luteoviolacea TaxID=43657 RepID=A0A167AXU4_9GAMM|nr:hypothetical protein N476_24630 [Pseudoalteromonas luteoviolacea H33]KZN71218.1 hypothetical protein N477_25650 [Pseudoalteromonas luteoviolacea H33-S]